MDLHLATDLPPVEGFRVQLGQIEALRARAATLNARQRDVWLRVVRGQLNKQIAAELGLVERTVKLHRARAMAKLGATSTAEMARIARAPRIGLNGASPKGSVMTARNWES